MTETARSETCFRVTSPLRLLGGSTVLGIAILLAMTARDIGWGLSVMLWLPAVLLCLPALALLRRQTLHCDAGELIIDSGWVFRRRLRLPMNAITLELLPTAGCRAVLAHSASGEHAIATWLSPGRAERLAAWLDAHNDAALPRRQRPLHRLDL